MRAKPAAHRSAVLNSTALGCPPPVEVKEQMRCPLFLEYIVGAGSWEPIIARSKGPGPPALLLLETALPGGRRTAPAARSDRLLPSITQRLLYEICVICGFPSCVMLNENRSRGAIPWRMIVYYDAYPPGWAWCQVHAVSIVRRISVYCGCQPSSV